ncbi:MAG: Condensin subunit ScpA [Candidatus Uhrbacteria bacterium GW2011_GWA2_53_10]|uniref:Segregation and condensation protein A n=1 Tax=Candidatus Uhrbacteria bacterium GW2011_GWA2_53_10 TaxID=1618980 RepID=A0A0G1XR07_9BACT|nr:MAG: Condensin subunit ScpA [Candidatus Uhrbacteria bacterium GW2011_GWA2_53_10]
MAFEVKLQQFAGPLQLLLDLIEEEQLPITEVALSDVTEAYLKHLEVSDVPPEELADFLVVATKLLLIKSRVLLPNVQPEEGEDPGTLADQLRLYQAFIEASRGIEKRFAGGPWMFMRPKPSFQPVRTFLPPRDLVSQALHTSFTQLLKRLEPFFALRQASLERVISVQERMEQIRASILERSRLTFQEMVAGSKRKVDVVVSFLALLELVKQRAVRVVQSTSFEDIVIKHVD